MVQRRTGTLARPFALVDRETAGQANLLAATVEDPAAVKQVHNVAVNARTTLNERFEMIDPAPFHKEGLRMWRMQRPRDAMLHRVEGGTADRCQSKISCTRC